MWPFASVMVAIVFLFLGDTMPIHRHGPVVDLPQGVHAANVPKAQREDAIHVQLTRDGRIFFGNMRAGPEELVDQIQKAVQEGDITILAEKSAPR